MTSLTFPATKQEIVESRDAHIKFTKWIAARRAEKFAVIQAWITNEVAPAMKAWIAEVAACEPDVVPRSEIYVKLPMVLSTLDNAAIQSTIETMFQWIHVSWDVQSDHEMFRIRFSYAY